MDASRPKLISSLAPESTIFIPDGHQDDHLYIDFLVQSAMSSVLKLEAQDGRADTYHKLSGPVEDSHQRPPGGGNPREDRALFHHCIDLRSRDVYQNNFQLDFTEHPPTCSYAVWHLMFTKDFPSLSLLVDSQLHTAIERFCKRRSANAN